MRKGVLTGVNDLQTWCEQNGRMELLLEWDTAKNGNLSPDSIVCHSNKSVWWKCSKGHEWASRIGNRTSLGRGCPYCAGRYPVKGVNDLQTLFPELAKEWHPTQNGNLKPTDVKAYTNKRVWWKCELGHEWFAMIESRTNGSGCPYCGNKKVLKGFNDLATKNPELVSEWDYEKNGKLTPDSVVFGSHEKVWWKCEYGHEWRTAIVSRTSGTNCPYCTGAGSSMPEQGIAYYLEKICTIEQRKRIDGKEIDIYLPDYRIGIEYDGILFHKGKESKDALKTIHLTERNIYLIRIKEAEANNIINDKVITFDGHTMNDNYVWALKQLFKILFKLTNNPDFDTISINLNSDILKIREKFNLYKKNNSLLISNPEIAKEWNTSKNGILKPDMFFSGTHQRVWWICSRGHEWQSSIKNRVSGSGCPYCTGQRAIRGETDLATTNPELAAEWNFEKNRKLKNNQGHDLYPYNISAGSHQIVWWIGKCGHEWDMPISDRTGKQLGCPYCSGHRLGIGINDLSTTNPELAAEWNYDKNGDLTPRDVTAGLNTIVWWKCEKGHEWKASLCNRSARKGTGCPYCSGRYAEKGVNDLLTLSPELSKEWHPCKNGELKPSDVKTNTNTKVWWKCSKGHEWQATIANRSNGRGCPYCSNKMVLLGFNDLATTNPYLALEWNYKKNGELTPRDVVDGSNKKVWWICKLGHEWESQVKDRSSGRGCPFCSNKKVLEGFNDLATKNPKLALEWNYEKNGVLTPKEVVFGSHKKVWWKCNNGHEWEAVIYFRTKGVGCPICSNNAPKSVLCIETGENYPSTAEAARQKGISQACVCACCNGKQKTAGGYHWKFVD